MGALAREMAGALRESMDILRAENQVQAHVAETRPSFLKREFFWSNPDEFLGDSKKPLKADKCNEDDHPFLSSWELKEGDGHASSFVEISCIDT